jgi:hypothetical protein
VSAGDGVATVRIRDGLVPTLWAFVGARVLLFVVSAVGVGLVAMPQGQPVGVPGWPARSPDQGWDSLVTATERQDALWYLRIATDGYSPDDASAAFFPAYPLAIRAVAWLPGVGALGAALVVSNAAAFGALLMLHALTRREFGDPALARRTVLLVALFPTGFFLLAPYTEATFLLLSVSAFWLARGERWGWAAAVGAGAALTRPIGVVVAIGLAVEAIRQWRVQGRPLVPRVLAVGTAGLAPLLYAGAWWVREGSPWAPVDAQANWQRDEWAPWDTVWQALDHAWRYRSWWLVDVVVVGLVVAGLLVVTRRVVAAYGVYAWISLLVPLTLPYPSRPLLSAPRFVLVLFPAFWGLALVAGRRRGVETALVAGSAAAYGVLGTLFVNWHPLF